MSLKLSFFVFYFRKNVDFDFCQCKLGNESQFIVASFSYTGLNGELIIKRATITQLKIPRVKIINEIDLNGMLVLQRSFMFK